MEKIAHEFNLSQNRCGYIVIGMEAKPFPLDVLEDDQANIHTSTELLKKYGIYELYEQTVPSLFRDLLPALQRNTPPGYFPFTRKTPGGIDVPTYDFVLRLFMFQSVHEQFIFAVVTYFEDTYRKFLDIFDAPLRAPELLTFQNPSLSLIAHVRVWHMVLLFSVVRFADSRKSLELLLVPLS